MIVGMEIKWKRKRKQIWKGKKRKKGKGNKNENFLWGREKAAVEKKKHKPVSKKKKRHQDVDRKLVKEKKKQEERGTERIKVKSHEWESASPRAHAFYLDFHDGWNPRPEFGFENDGYPANQISQFWYEQRHRATPQ